MLKAIRHNIVPTTPGHIKQVVLNLREADRLEIEALGLTPLRGIMLSVRTSLWARSLIWDRPVAIFGVCGTSHFAATLTPWCVTTNDVNKRPIEFMRASRHVMDEYMGTYKHLYNVVDDRHEQSKRWLQRLGFTLHQPIPFGKDDMLFRPFEMRRA